MTICQVSLAWGVDKHSSQREKRFAAAINERQLKPAYRHSQRAFVLIRWSADRLFYPN